MLPNGVLDRGNDLGVVVDGPIPGGALDRRQAIETRLLWIGVKQLLFLRAPGCAGSNQGVIDVGREIAVERKLRRRRDGSAIRSLRRGDARRDRDYYRHEYGRRTTRAWHFHRAAGKHAASL